MWQAVYSLSTGIIWVWSTYNHWKWVQTIASTGGLLRYSHANLGWITMSYRWVSSAERLNPKSWRSVRSVISSLYAANSNGPRTETWTQPMIARSSDISPTQQPPGTGTSLKKFSCSRINWPSVSYTAHAKYYSSYRVVLFHSTKSSVFSRTPKMADLMHYIVIH